MADVQFLGFGNTGFPDPDVRILPANAAQGAEVSFLGIGATAVGELSTETEIFSPTLTAAPEFTEVSFDTVPAPVNAIESPNVNDIILFVVGGPTSGSLFVNVRTVSADFELNGRPAGERLVNDNLRLYAGPRSPSGLAGKIAHFLNPTGMTTPAPILGVTGLVKNISDGAAPGTPTGSQPLVADSILIEFEGAIPVQPTIGDRFMVRSTDQTLRRTPILEIFLSQYEE